MSTRSNTPPTYSPNTREERAQARDAKRAVDEIRRKVKRLDSSELVLRMMEARINTDSGVKTLRDRYTRYLVRRELGFNAARWDPLRDEGGESLAEVTAPSDLERSLVQSTTVLATPELGRPVALEPDADVGPVSFEVHALQRTPPRSGLGAIPRVSVVTASSLPLVVGTVVTTAASVFAESRITTSISAPLVASSIGLPRITPLDVSRHLVVNTPVRQSVGPISHPFEVQLNPHIVRRPTSEREEGAVGGIFPPYPSLPPVFSTESSLSDASVIRTLPTEDRGYRRDQRAYSRRGSPLRTEKPSIVRRSYEEDRQGREIWGERKPLPVGSHQVGVAEVQMDDEFRDERHTRRQGRRSRHRTYSSEDEEIEQRQREMSRRRLSSTSSETSRFSRSRDDSYDRVEGRPPYRSVNNSPRNQDHRRTDQGIRPHRRLSSRPLAGQREPSPPRRYRTSAGKAVDVLHKWRISYENERKEGARSFLERLEHCCRGSGLQTTDVLDALPVVFTGEASKWYRLTGKYCHTWRDFEHDFLQRFEERDHRRRLKEEAKNRLQGAQEGIVEFVENMETIFSYLDPPLREKRRLDIIYDNLRPAYGRYFLRSQVKTIRDLLDLGKELERKWAKERLRKGTLVNTGQAAVPSAVYKPSREGRDHVAAVADSSKKHKQKKNPTKHSQPTRVVSPVNATETAKVDQIVRRPPLSPKKWIRADQKRGVSPKETFLKPNKKTHPCFNCFQLGHWANECPLPRRVRGKEPTKKTKGNAPPARPKSSENTGRGERQGPAPPQE